MNKKFFQTINSKNMILVPQRNSTSTSTSSEQEIICENGCCCISKGNMATKYYKCVFSLIDECCDFDGKTSKIVRSYVEKYNVIHWDWYVHEETYIYIYFSSKTEKEVRLSITCDHVSRRNFKDIIERIMI